MPQSNELLPMEREWLERYIRRLTSRVNNWLSLTPKEEDQLNILRLFTQEVNFCKKLLEKNVVLPEDRLPLREILIGERRILHANTDPEVKTEREAEVAVINGFLRHLSER